MRLSSLSFAGLLATSAAAMTQQHDQEVPPVYLFAFGDSYTQTSFDPAAEQPSASNPMGNPALGQGTTTGGVNWVGFLAEKYNKTLVLAYDLAVGGATIDNTIVTGYPSDLVSQIETFNSYYKDSPSSAPWTSSDAVFAFWIGVNDAGYSYSNSNPENITTQLTTRYESLIEEIYQAGGRKFVILNVPQISLAPTYQSQGEAVVQALASYLTIFNQAIADMVADFEKNHSDATVVLYDTFTFMSAVLASPTSYGYPSDDAASCYNADGVTCVWWNDLHPGLAYHQLMAENMTSQISSLGGW